MIHALIFAAASTFTSLSLSQAQEAAVSHSPDVIAASQRVAENAALLSAARGAFGPAATINYAQAPQGTTNTAGLPQTIEQHLTTVGGQITLGDVLSYSPAVAQAAANLAAARSDFIAAQQAERTKVTGLYFDALRAIATAQTRSDALSAAQADRRAAQIRFDAGDAPRLDVVRADVAVARAVADVETATATKSNAIEALAVETAQPVQSLSTPVAQTALPAGPVSVDSAVARALVRRPEIASAHAAVNAQAASVRVAESGVLPTVTASAGYTHGIDSGVAVRGPSANVQLTLPLSTAAGSRASAERARLAQAQAKLAGTQRQITLEVSAAVRTYQAGVRALAAATQAREQAQAELNAITTGYRSGASSSLEVSAARQTYVQAVLDELTAYYAQAQARATLDVLMGP